MKTRTLFLLAGVGIFAGLLSVWIYNEKVKTLAPLAVNYNPYEAGLYANGIVESFQTNGSNINMYPEVSGTVTQIFVKEGQTLKKGSPILLIDDSVQRSTVEANAAQVEYAKASLVNAQQQLDKIQKSYDLDVQSISKNTLDNAINAVKIAKQSVDVAVGQYKASKALLEKYLIKAPVESMVFRVVAATGSYASPLGSFDTYSQTMLPTVQMGVVTPHMQVRCFLDEILISKLPVGEKLKAILFVRGERERGIELEFVNIQPYTVPNIQLSDERLQRVDVRVLPVIFKFKKPADMNIFPGQLVDIYIKGKK